MAEAFGYLIIGMVLALFIVPVLLAIGILAYSAIGLIVSLFRK